MVLAASFGKSRGRAALIVPGELQVTAGHSFTHMLKFEKRQEHVLVTDGIYRCAACGAMQ